VARLPGPYPYLRFNRLSTDLRPILTDILSAKTGVNQALGEAQKLADQIMAEPVRVQ
jgi:hypothetical protein